MRVLGVLEPPGGSFNGFDTAKEELENQFVVGSSFLQEDGLDLNKLAALNSYLEETEKI